MEKIPFEILGLNTEPAIATVKVGDKEVLVKQYLPVERKESLINLALQDAIDYSTGMINRIKADALFDSYVVSMYTNIQVDSKLILEYYDIMEANGVIDTIMSAIPEVEINSLIEYYEVAIGSYNKYKTSVAGVVSQVVNDLPNALKQVNQSMEDFDPSMFSEVVGMVKAVGGNDNAVTNLILGQK